MTKQCFHLTRQTEQNLHLESLFNGSHVEEIRIWNLSSFLDPQGVLILKKLNSDSFVLRSITYSQKNHDSVYSDRTVLVDNGNIKTLDLQRYWHLQSQSDLKNGDSYSCLDGSDIFFEIANAANYRFMWYRCPDINGGKDSAFHQILDLTRKLGKL